MLRSEVHGGFLEPEEKTPSTFISRIRQNHKTALNVAASVSFATSLLVTIPAVAQDKGLGNMITCQSGDKKTTYTIDPYQFVTQDESKRELLLTKDPKKRWTNPLGIAQKDYESEMCRRAVACEKSPKCS